MQYGEKEPFNLYTSPVLRKAKSERANKEFLSSDPIKAIQLMKQCTAATTIQNIGLEPFYVHYWSGPQIDIYRRYAKGNHSTLFIDATGNT